MRRYLLAFLWRSLYLFLIFCFFAVVIHAMMGNWHRQLKPILFMGLYFAPIYSAYLTWKALRRQPEKLAEPTL